MDIAIIGGGIAGLSLAMNLHDRGIRAHVFERAPEIKELGVGITLLPHAMREFAALGLRDELLRAGVVIREKLLLQPVRPAHLPGGPWPARGLRLSGSEHPSRPSPRDPIPRRARAARRRSRPHRPRMRSGRAGRERRNESISGHSAQAPRLNRLAPMW